MRAGSTSGYGRGTRGGAGEGGARAEGRSSWDAVELLRFSKGETCGTFHVFFFSLNVFMMFCRVTYFCVVK